MNKSVIFVYYFFFCLWFFLTEGQKKGVWRKGKNDTFCCGCILVLTCVSVGWDAAHSLKMNDMGSCCVAMWGGLLFDERWTLSKKKTKNKLGGVGFRLGAPPHTDAHTSQKKVTKVGGGGRVHVKEGIHGVVASLSLFFLLFQLLLLLFFLNCHAKKEETPTLYCFCYGDYYYY